MNRSCPRLPSSCPKLLGERASTTCSDWNTQVEHLKVVMRIVIGTHMLAVPWRNVSAENVSLEINKSVDRLCSNRTGGDHIAAVGCPQEGTRSRIEKKNKGKDLFETTKPQRVTVTYRSTSLPQFLSLLCIEEYNLLIDVHEEGHRDHPLACPCLVVRGLPLHAVHIALDVHVVDGSSCRYDSISDEL